MGLTRKSAKIALPILTILPYILYLSALASIVLKEPIGKIFSFIQFAFLLMPGLWVFYFIIVCRNDNITSRKKALWAVLMFFGGFVVVPIYWYVHILRKPVNG
jgi:hypothetical protein